MTVPLPLPDLQRPEGPRGHPLLGHLPQLRQDALGFLRHSRAAYGDVFPIRFGRQEVLVVADPAAAREVLVTKAASFRKGRGIQKMEPFLGTGLLAAEGEVWRGHRRLMQPSFHRSALEGMAGDIVASAEPMLRELARAAQSGAEVDVGSEMLRVALRAVATVLFGTALRDEDLAVVERELPPLLTSTANRIRSLVDWDLPTPPGNGRRRRSRPWTSSSTASSASAGRRAQGGMTCWAC